MEGKSGIIPALNMSVGEHRDTEGNTSEDSQWCLSEDELRNMSAERKAEHDAFEARRRLEREAKDEEQMSNCYGKFSWKCTVSGTNNAAIHHKCQGTVKAND